MTSDASTDPTGTDDIIRYTGYSVYRRTSGLDRDNASAAEELTALVRDLAGRDVVVRGFYDVSGMRADADLLVWWHAPTAEALQAAARALRATAVGRGTAATWSVIGLHRQAEFNKAHVPAFLAGEPPRQWVTVYPFVRSHEWYLLPETERRALLGEHGMLGRDHPDVLTNTVAGFALGDYEWLLAIESDQLHEIVDMMRHLRVSATRRHVRLETPFFTGRRIDEAGVVEVLE
ncbi:MAG TPA: hydrogen peroxide-dependent heme synthase [Nakamurella sp.]|jgi:chlorite dismutase|nr:hydrogen peroxide-dependent heme synthase [Nakamurella sp.]